MPLFDDGPYAANAIADQDSMLIRLHKPTFLDLLKENSDINLDFSNLLSKRLRYIEKILSYRHLFFY
jgi:CRP-like cAMP-binding protein